MPPPSPPPPEHAVLLRLEGPLRAPVDGRLRSRVLELLRSGHRSIVLDLDGVSRIDAAGVGELVGLYRMASAVNGTLRVVHLTAWVCNVLERVGLLELLTQSPSRPARRRDDESGMRWPATSSAAGQPAHPNGIIVEMEGGQEPFARTVSL